MQRRSLLADKGRKPPSSKRSIGLETSRPSMKMEKRLSLVAQFDDLVRNTSVLASDRIEKEFVKFAQSQEVCRKKWLDLEHEVDELRSKIKILESENNALQNHLKHARTQIQHEMQKRSHMQNEKDALDRQVDLVKELLNEKGGKHLLDDQRLSFLSTGRPSHLTSPHQAPQPQNLATIDESVSMDDLDISYDKTGDDLDGNSYLRSGRSYRSKRHGDDDVTPPGKKSKKESRYGKYWPTDYSQDLKHSARSNSSIVTTTTVVVEDGVADVQSEIKAAPPRNKPPRRRSKSCPDKRAEKRLKASEVQETYQNAKRPDTQYHSSPIQSRSPRHTTRSPSHTDVTPPTMRRYNSTGKLNNRPHVFSQKTAIKPETCNPCGKRIRFGKPSMKCKDCKAVAHPECKEQVPLPCIPVTLTPGLSKQQFLLEDYISGLDHGPRIPAIVIHCANEVIARGLGEVGLYRVPGAEREVKQLKEKFLSGKGTPNLSHVDDIHVVCGCLKDFLRNLKEPLVTYSLWERFVKAAEIMDRAEAEERIYQAISELPQANRDTMAFLVLHLLNVSESHECKMPVSNLAKVFGPSVVGYSCAEPEPMQTLSETRRQPAVLELMMSLPVDYWESFINGDVEEERTLYTPGDKNQVMHSMLGPISTPSEEEAAQKRWLNTPRFGSKSKHVNRKPNHFFSSPNLK